MKKSNIFFRVVGRDSARDTTYTLGYTNDPAVNAAEYVKEGWIKNPDHPELSVIYVPLIKQPETA